MKILIIAHEFSPYLGSECSVGWNIVNQISKFHEVVVISARTNQFGSNSYVDDVEHYFSSNSGISFFDYISIPQPKNLQWLIKFNKYISGPNSAIGLPFIYFYVYRRWQKDVYKFVISSKFIDDVDVIHQLTSISFREPGYLLRLNKPFVWGPISGNVRIPIGFFNLLTLENRFFQVIRNVLIYLQLNYSFRILSAAKKASFLYCVTKEDFDHFSKINNQNCISLLDVGSSIYSSINEKNLNSKELITFVWIGRIVYSKAIEILIHALNNINKTNLQNKIEVIVIGNGPDLNRNKLLAEKLNINNILWTGEVSHAEAMKLLCAGDCLIHTSIREATSAVVLESLSHGVPVICHDAFGMSVAVDETCGVKVPFVNFDTSVLYFTNAIMELVNNPLYLKNLRSGAIKRSSELTWEEMAKIISSNYYRI